ncbi:thermonuclease family protein [Bacillus sp. AR18-7]|uniref:thermonuclease family protein n=1 Tax=Bacillus sp. AR18-7 TaxID=2217821 RepID=UPI0011CA677E|nr:thermonuclease family protein [Bacillus sp. AR18-7]TXR64485.1 thermonuclease [Bacillus sp. AR18-7]
MKKLVLIVAATLLVLSGCVSDKVGTINNVESKLKSIKSKVSEVEGSLNSELKQNDTTSLNQRDVATVTSIADGDTITIKLLANSKLDTGKKGETFKVRYLCIDTPESVKKGVKVQPVAKEASNFNKQLLLGKKVHLEYENNKYDKYHRLLAYVFLEDELVQETMLKRGFGIIRYSNGNTRYKEKLQTAEQVARTNKSGVWGIDGYVINGKYNLR